MAKTKLPMVSIAACSTPDLVPNRPTEKGYTVGKVLAMYADEQLEGKTDERCKSCAFRLGTIPNGCEATVMDVVKCLLEMNPFLCHEPRPHDGGEEVLCAGYAALLASYPSDARRIKAPWDYSYPEDAK